MMNVIELKNWPMGLNNRLDQPEERICKLEHTSFVIFAVRTEKRKKNMKKREERLKWLMNTIKGPICALWEVQRREKRSKTIICRSSVQTLPKSGERNKHNWRAEDPKKDES